MLVLARTLGIPRLTAAHFVDNPASGAVLRKLGFRPTGRRIERASLGRGTPAPTVEYVREVAAPGQDRDDDDGPVAMLGAARWPDRLREEWRSEEHTSELPSLMRNSYSVFCLKKKQKK